MRVMRKKGNKYNRYPPNKGGKGQQKNQIEHLKSKNYGEKCGCGNDLIFDKCCYREDHRVFKLAHYLDKLKNIKLKVNEIVQRRFLHDYKNNKKIRKITDKLSDDMKIRRVSQLINEVLSGHVVEETASERVASSIHFETLALDLTLPGHEKPIFQEYLRFYLRKVSNRVKNCYTSLSKSQFSLYEVIEVKKAKSANFNTWVLLKDLFTKKEHVIKDPLITSRLYIWDVVIGRLYRVAGFNLFSTAVFMLNPYLQKIFNRMLFMFWLKDIMVKKPNTLNILKSKYPQLNVDFSHKYMLFLRDYFPNIHIQKFLKMNSSLLPEIMRLMNRISPEYPLIVKSPDHKDIFFAECKGELIHEKENEAVEAIRSNIECFREVPEGEASNKVSFDYIISRVDSPIDLEITKKNIIPENLVKLSKEAITRKILELFQKTVIFGVTHVMSDWSMEQQDAVIENLSTGPNVRVGFLEIKRNKIKLVTYSKESMKELLKHVKRILKPSLEQLSPPIYSDILEKSHYHAQISKQSDDLSFDEKIEVYEDIKRNMDALELSPEYDHKTSDEEEALHLESRMMRYYLMKRWVNQKIPLLGGKTPKESLRDTKNIPLLIDMIKERENDDDRNGEFNSNQTYSTYLGIDVAHYKR